MCDCAACAAFAPLPTDPELPCLRSGDQVFKDDAASGVRQLPLTHLLYSIAAGHVKPVRQTWPITWYGPVQEGFHLKYTRNFHESSVRHLLGMVLTQRVLVLPLWAQLHPDAQRRMATVLAALALGTQEEQRAALRESLELQALNGLLYDTYSANAVAEELLQVEARYQHLTESEPRRRDRLTLVERRVEELEAERGAVAGREGALRRLIQGPEDRRRAIRKDMPRDVFEEDGSIANELVVEVAVEDYMGEGDPETLLAEYRLLLQEEAQHRANLQPIQQRLAALDGEIGALRQEVHDGRRALRADTEDQEWCAFYLPTLREEHRLLTLVMPRQTRDEAQGQALDGDFGLQLANYHTPAFGQQLIEIIRANATARQIYLFLHPKIKYEWTEPTACRYFRLLACPEFLGAWRALDQAHMIQPGPFAKLGVFIANSFTPGSYGFGQVNRELVQEETQQILLGMREYGLGDRIVCHSCGSETPDGYSPDERRRQWVRDHNPPTGLYSLGTVVLGKLNLPCYNGNGKHDGQILLPHCRECSKRQGAITGRVTALIDKMPQRDANLANPLFNLLDYLQAQLEPEEWADFQRLVLQPGHGWAAGGLTRQPQGTGLVRGQQGLDLSQLVTTGVAGSFSGIDEAFLYQLGNELGCHTCTDVQVQNDPFRHISWIADHQPPTGLVERGLMELPQVLHPHCWKCSSQQSQLIATLARLFDACFGGEYKLAWKATLQALKSEPT